MQYKKPIFVLLLSSMLAPLSYADVYAVVGGGVTEGTFEYKLVDTPQVDHLGEINGMGQAGLGLAEHYKDFFGGIEGGFEWQGFDATNTTTVIQTSPYQLLQSVTETSLNHDYYVHIKAGYIIKNAFIVYGLAGVIWGDFTIQDVGSDMTVYQRESLTQTGYRLGLGVSNRVLNHFEWRLEYTFNSYGDIGSSLFDPISVELLTYSREDIAINQVLLGFGYYF